MVFEQLSLGQDLIGLAPCVGFLHFFATRKEEIGKFCSLKQQVKLLQPTQRHQVKLNYVGSVSTDLMTENSNAVTLKY